MVSVEKIKSLGVKTGLLCDNCNQELLLITSFGNEVCKYCYLQKEHKKGHSGMLSLSERGLETQLLTKRFLYAYDPIKLLKVTKGNKTFSSLYLSHYPQSKGIVGRTFNYLILNQYGFIAGIIGACSPPITVTEVDRYFDITKENRISKVNSILNNNVFRIVNNKKQIPNFGTIVLKKFRQQLQKDYYNKYKEKLKGLITFVEPPRNGTIYLADNWDYLGKTKGYRVTKRGKMTEYKKFSKGLEEQQKLIFGYKFKGYYDW